MSETVVETDPVAVVDLVTLKLVERVLVTEVD